MNVIVTAGGRPQPGDPLYPLTQGGVKAMLNVAGKPMIQWVLDALGGSSAAGHILVVGLPALDGLTCSKPLSSLPDAGDMLANIQAGARELARLDPAAQHVLVCSSDIPALRPEMVDWLAAEALKADADLCYNVIRREVMETRFPGSRRTYVRLVEGRFCGGDLNAVRQSVALGRHPAWERIIAARKNPLRQAGLLGLDTLLLLLAGRLSLPRAEQSAARHLGIHGRALLCPYAELGMDVDKPFQLELLERSMR